MTESVPVPQKWVELLCKRDVNRLTKLYLPTATCWLPTNTQCVQGHRAIRSQLEELARRDALFGTTASLAAHNLGRTRLFTGELSLGWRDKGIPRRARFRLSMLVVPTRIGERIVHHHLSAPPKIARSPKR
jgi:ketosteroid isomerase-like protein